MSSLILFARDFGDLAQVTLAGYGDGQHGRCRRVELLHDRRIGAFRQPRYDGGDFVADVLRRGIAIALEDEDHRHVRHTLVGLGDAARSMPSMVLIASSIGLVTLLSISSTLAPVSVVVTVTIGKSTLGKRSTARLPVREQAKHDQEADQHGRRHGTANTQVHELHCIDLDDRQPWFGLIVTGVLLFEFSVTSPR